MASQPHQVPGMTSRQRTHDAARIAQGWRRVQVWFDPETLEALARLRAYGSELSEQAAIRWAINQSALTLAHK